LASRFIDVWDAKTFDGELAATLTENSDLIRNYTTTAHKIFLAYDLGREPKLRRRPTNPFSSDFTRLKEAIGELMECRTIRAWHYTRLTDPEVQIFQRAGIHLSTPAALRTRFDALVTSGGIAPEVADSLYNASPFHSDQWESRLNKFWMASHPVAIDHPGVERLMAYWGGEVASWWTQDPRLLAPLAAAGKPRVVQLAVPLALTRCAIFAGEAVVTTFGRTLGITGLACV
jgi:hypothetical protein